MPPRALPASRELPLVPEEAALLVVDVQRYCRWHVQRTCAGGD